MDATAVERLVTDALLLDAVEGLDSIAARLVGLYDGGGRGRDSACFTEELGVVLSELGWWSGRLLGAVSTETAAVVDCLASDDA